MVKNDIVACVGTWSATSPRGRTTTTRITCKEATWNKGNTEFCADRRLWGPLAVGSALSTRSRCIRGRDGHVGSRAAGERAQVGQSGISARQEEKLVVGLLASHGHCVNTHLRMESVTWNFPFVSGALKHGTWWGQTWDTLPRGTNAYPNHYTVDFSVHHNENSALVATLPFRRTSRLTHKDVACITHIHECQIAPVSATWSIVSTTKQTSDVERSHSAEASALSGGRDSGPNAYHSPQAPGGGRAGGHIAIANRGALGDVWRPRFAARSGGVAFKLRQVRPRRCLPDTDTAVQRSREDFRSVWCDSQSVHRGGVALKLLQHLPC